MAALVIGIAFTITVTSVVAASAPSVAVKRSTWIPAVENIAVVVSALGFPNVTGPDPLTWLQVTVSVLPSGRPSSVTVPEKFAAAGKVIVRRCAACTTTGVLYGRGT